MKNLWKVKKADTPLPSNLVHLYVRDELLSPHEHEVYDDLVSVQKYRGLEMDSQEEPDSFDALALPPALTPPAKNRSDSVPKTPKSKQAGPSQLATRLTKAELAGTPSPPFSPLIAPVMTSLINEDIMELLVHRAK